MKSTYNNNILGTVEKYISYIIDRVSKKSKNASLELVAMTPINGTEYQISDLLENEQTDNFMVLCTVKVTEGNETNQIQDTIEIPRMINDIFIIEGKYRITTNTMGNSGTCRMFRRDQKVVRFVFDYGFLVKFKADSPLISTVIEVTDEDGEKITFEGTEENLGKFKEFTKISEEQRTLLRIKMDTDYIPEYLDYDLLKKIWELPDDRDADLIIDKRISTIESDFERHLWMPDNRRKVITKVSNRWWKYHRLDLAEIQRVMIGYFKGAKSKCIEIPATVNPLVYDSLKYKLIMPRTVPFNKTFTDLIDPSNTPENGNVNRINELNVCTSIEKGVIYYTCYNLKSGEKVKMKYIDYLDKKVLLNTYYDYKDKKVIKSPTYEYTYHLKTHKVDQLPDDIELVEPHPDEKLSVTVRRIPMVNMCDSVRVSMGASMIKQSIEIVGSEPRRISAGHDTDDIESSASIIRYNGPIGGKIVEIGSEIIVMTDAGIPYPIEVPTPTVGSNNAIITYDCRFKVGDRVEPGQVVISPRTMIQDNYSLGLNAKAIYMNYLGFTFEDGVVISESYARRCMSYSIVRGSQKIKTNSKINFVKPIGSHLGFKDVLVGRTVESRIHRKIKDAVNHDKDAANIVNLNRETANIEVPNNIDEGYLVDIRWTPNTKSKKTLDKTSLELISKIGEDRSDDYKDIPDKYKHLKSQGQGFEFGDGDLGAISYTILKINPMKIGDKSCNSYGSKGIISLVVPDELMPRVGTDDDGNGGTPAEIIMNPAAVISRKNVSQLYEVNLNNCIDKIYEIVGQKLNENDYDGIRRFTKEYYGDRFVKLTDEEIRRAYDAGIISFQMEVGCYSKLSYETVIKWMKDLKVEEGEYAFIPDVVIYEDENGTKVCSPEYAAEHDIKGKTHELGFTEEPVIFGQSYMYKLYHAADYSGKVTSSIKTSNEPVMGRGLYRNTGQKIGEMEYWGLLSSGTTSFLTRDKQMIEEGENTFLQELLLSGFVLTDSLGLPINSEYQQKLKQLIEK